MGGAGTFYRKSSATEQDIFGWSYVRLPRSAAAGRSWFRSGRARTSGPTDSIRCRAEWPSYREHMMQWVSELRQSMDYLQSRDDMSR